MRARTVGSLVIAAAFFAVATMPRPASAQGISASIAGNVKDASGADIPGVTVEVASPALIEKVRVTTTDGQGNYKITELRPGVYSVTFSLTGFSSVKREGIELSSGFSAPVNAELKVGSITETITVTGAAPIVDVQSVRTQNVLSAEVLDALPSGQRDTVQLAALTLGAMPQAGRNDVGGDKGERSTGVSIHGSRLDDAKLNYDGMNTNVFFGGGGGQQRTYKFNTVMVAETVLDTGGNSAESPTGGANINMVPKDGGNRFSFSGSANYTGESLASGKVPDDLLARGSTPDQNSMKQVWDYGFGVGGPIKQDKVWFYSGNRLWGSQAYFANNYFNKSTNFYSYVPDLNRRAFVDINQSDFGGRITWQINAKQKLAVEQHYQESCACWQQLAANTAPEAALSFGYTPHYLTQAAWTYPASSKLLFQAGMSYLRAQVQFISVGGADVPGRLPVTDSNVPGIGAYTWGGISPLGLATILDNGDPQRQDNANYRFGASYITGSHALKVGFQGLRGTYNTRGNVPGAAISLGLNAGVPNSVTQFAVPNKADSRVQSQAVYAQDEWTIKRLTLTAGVRYDHFNVKALAIDVPAGPYIGQRHYDARENIPNYNDITPRFGAAYDLFGDGRTAIRGSWGRYLVGLGGGAITTLAPSNAINTFTGRPWNDNPLVATPGTDVFGNGDFMPTCNLTILTPNGECGAINNPGFGSPVPTTNWDENARQGWGVREYSNQWSVSVQRELRPGFGVTAGFYHTSFHNTQVAVNTALDASFFDTYCVPSPTDARLGVVSGQQVCGNINQNFQAKTIPANTIWYRLEDAPVPGLSGERREVYNGGDISLNWRFRPSGLISGGVSLGKQVTDTCFANTFPQITGTVSAGGVTNLGNLRNPDYCSNEAVSLWNGAGSQVKLQMVYPLPYEFMLAATYKHLPGVPQSGTVTYANAAIAPSLGRNISQCTLPTGACTSTIAINVVQPGTLFDDRLNQIDLRGTRPFHVGPGRGRLLGVVELYNITNARTPQASTGTWGSVTAPGTTVPGTTYLRPSDFLGGRLVKFGVQVDW